MNKQFIDGFMAKCAQEGLLRSEAENFLKEALGPLALGAGYGAGLGGTLGGLAGIPLGAFRHLWRDDDDEASLLRDLAMGAGTGALAGGGLGALGGAGLGAVGEMASEAVKDPEVQRQWEEIKRLRG